MADYTRVAEAAEENRWGLTMFPNTSIEELTSDKVYQLSHARPLYLELLRYYEKLFDYPKALVRWEQFDAEAKTENMWWTMNEGWESFCKLNPELPIHWLAQAHRALYWDHIPSNFHPWALAILEKFDLDRYQVAYHLPDEEYQAIARDLPVVLEGLRNYPPEKFGPPIDEDNWGFSDQ